MNGFGKSLGKQCLGLVTLNCLTAGWEMTYAPLVAGVVAAAIQVLYLENCYSEVKNGFGHEKQLRNSLWLLVAVGFAYFVARHTGSSMATPAILLGLWVMGAIFLLLLKARFIGGIHHGVSGFLSRHSMG